MCLLVLACGVRPDYPLVVAANRDEYYVRRTAAADFWEDAPELLAGRDIERGGTWMGVTRWGRFAAITNYRDPARVLDGVPSRGSLVADFLRGSMTAEEYRGSLEENGGRYAPFNLVFGTGREFYCFSNVDGRTHRLGEGIWGLTNHMLNTKWPKVYRLGKAMEEALGEEEEHMAARLFDALGDRKPAPDELLPDTGVGQLMERALSPPFVHIPAMGYGTRSSTVLTYGENGRVLFVERTFGAESQFAGEVTHRFSIAR